MSLESALAGCFKKGMGIFTSQAEHAQAGVVGLLGEGARIQERFEVAGGVRSDFPGLLEQPIGIQLEDEAVAGGHMLGPGGKGSLRAAARMHSHLLAFVEDLHHALRCLDLHLLPDQGMRNGVEMLLKGHMVVNTDLRRLPQRELVGCFGQRAQRGLVDFLEQLAA